MMDIKQYHTKYFNKIQQDKNQQQEELIKIALQAIPKAIKEKKKFDWANVKRQLTNEIYNSLTTTLSHSLSLVKEAYAIKDKKLDLKNLIWQKDGKLVEDRISSYCHAISTMIELTEEPNEQSLKNLLTYNLTRLLNTETMAIHNKAVWQLVKDKAIYVEIWNEDDQCDGNCGCDVYYDKGKFLLKDLAELPPYHPDCECYPVYYMKDEEIEND